MLTVPFAIDRINQDNLSAVLSDMKRNQTNFVFFCMFKNFYENGLQEQLEKYAHIKPIFEKENIRTGIWVNCFGHDPIEAPPENKKYTIMHGFDFRKNKGTFCPLDPNFRKAYFSYIQKLASSQPDIILLDDDFRLSIRSYGIGCACKYHKKEFRRLTGKAIPSVILFQKMFSGGENSLRNAWLKVSNDSLLSFAQGVRKSIDEINPDIRAGFCSCFDTWDVNGTDVFTLASAFAGKTKPFIRTIGAPYWPVKTPWGSLRSVINYTRMQLAWCQGKDIDVLYEGDVFPRPRYNVPSSFLEAYHLAILPESQNILKYMYDYTFPYGYETGYSDHHFINTELRTEILSLFENKTPVGIKIYEEMHKIKSWDIPKKPTYSYRFPLPPCIQNYIARQDYITYSFFDRAPRFLSGIPFTFEEGNSAVVCFGENARSLPERYADRGLFLDAVAARILTDRAWDVGFERKPPYTYENSKGQRFFVLSLDGYNLPLSGKEETFFTYELQQSLIGHLEWVSRQPLPIFIEKQKDLHVVVSQKENTYAVGITNCSPDAVALPVIKTSLSIQKIRYIHCLGSHNGQNVYLNGKIEPYSFVGMEITV